MRTLLINEGDIDPARLVPILHYDGTPITARFIVKAIGGMLDRDPRSAAQSAAVKAGTPIFTPLTLPHCGREAL